MVVTSVTLATVVTATPAQQAPPSQGISPDLEMQILLDRAGFSPGEIDGRSGQNTARALAAFQRAKKLATADLAALRQAAGPAGGELLSKYTITAEDADGPFAKAIPKDLMAQAELPALHYTSLLEALGERFHSSPALLRQLNPGARFDGGETIVVPNVATQNPAAPPPNAKLVVSRSGAAATLFDANGQVLFHAPVTSGSEHDPLPAGTWAVTAVIRNPTFNYNPDLFWDANPAHAKAKIPPGPNGPVGLVWIDLTKEHYGIHGTPEPSRIGYTSSHGCVRLTNWDAMRLASLVQKGTAVIFEP